MPPISLLYSAVSVVVSPLTSTQSFRNSLKLEPNSMRHGVFVFWLRVPAAAVGPTLSIFRFTCAPANGVIFASGIWIAPRMLGVGWGANWLAM